MNYQVLKFIGELFNGLKNNLNETFIVIFVVFLIILMFYLFATYIIGSLGMMELAKKDSVKYGWLAWLPFGNMYVLGQLAFGKKIGWIYFGTAFLPIVTQAIFREQAEIPQSIVSVISFILYVITMYVIFKRRSKKAVMMTIWNVLSWGSLGSIFLYAIRNNEIIEENVWTKPSDYDTI